MLLCELDGWVLRACSLGCWWMLFCELDGGARGHAVWGAGGCCFASLTCGC